MESRVSRRFALCAGVLLLLMPLAAYIPAMQGAFIWDDDRWVIENTLLHDLRGLYRIWFDILAHVQYYPTTLTGFWAQYQLWELHPTGYHVVNVLIHGMSGIVLWRLLKRLAVPGAWVAAAIFVMHPVQVESVAWVTELKNVLSGFFYISSFYLMTRYFRLDKPTPAAPEGGSCLIGEPDNSPRDRSLRVSWMLYLGGLMLYLLAISSKSVTATLPAAMLVVLWWKRGRIKLFDGMVLAPFFVCGVSFGLLTAWMEQRLGAMGEYWDYTFIERFIIAGRALWMYLWKLAFPYEIIFVYPRFDINAGQAWQYAFPIAFLAMLGVFFVFRKRIGRGPLAAMLFFAGTLFPALGFLNVYPHRFSFVADHFQYLACLGPLALAVGVVTTQITKHGFHGAKKGAVIALVCVLLALYGVKDWRLGYHYKDHETLYRAIIAENPNAAMAHHNLGIITGNRGENEAALQHFLQAAANEKNAHGSLYDIGVTLVKLGRYREAVPYFLQAIEIEPKMFPEYYNDLGVALANMGELKKAFITFREAARIKPMYTEALDNMKNVYALIVEQEQQKQTSQPAQPQQ